MAKSKENVTKKKKGTRKSAQWNRAELDYAGLYAMSIVPFLSDPPAPKTFIRRLEAIVRDCPEFWPAAVDLCIRKLALGDEAGGKRLIEEGFPMLLKRADPEELEEAVASVIENLENVWRYDIIRTLLEPLVKRCPGSSKFRDSLAHAAVRMGDNDSALLHITEALKIAPDDGNLWSNKGWILLIAGNIAEAHDALKKAREIAPGNDVAKGNLDIYRYLKKNGGNYSKYLLRPLDWNLIRKLECDEKYDKLDEVCGEINLCRREAMAQAFLLEGGRKRALLPGLLSTLKAFFGFVRRINNEGLFLEEDVSYIHIHFKPIMHKFIFKFKDIDQELFDELYESLFIYYDFLATHRLVNARDVKDFKKDALGMKAELNKKMLRYNAVRKDEKMSEGEKERVRYELFEGDHDWPTL
jgi:hypothetical protein